MSSLMPTYQTLPKLEWVPTKAFTSRHGIVPHILAFHRWSGGTLQSVERWFENPADDASAHFVYAGEIGPNKGRCAQQIRIADKAWTQAAWNPYCISIECADAMWLGQDWVGLARLARIGAFLCKTNNIKPWWRRGSALHMGDSGCVRHADLGFLGGAHPSCPTTDVVVWEHFINMLNAEYHRGQFRTTWAR